MSRHILFAAFQTDRKANGGMESATQIFEALAGDFRWTLLTDCETAQTERWRAGGARVVRMAFDERAGALTRWLQLGRASTTALVRAWRDRPNLLHANDIRSARILLPVAALTGSPLAFTLRGAKPARDSYGRHWRRVGRKLAGMVTLSDEMGRLAAERLGVPAERIVTINSMVNIGAFRPPDLEERAALRARLGIARDEIAVGMVAHFMELKRQLEVIRDVMPRLKGEGVRLHLVGDFLPETDPYCRLCAEAAARAGLRGGVTFHGFRADVSDWLAALDIVLVASREEGLARCMIEAMACGTPVVSFDVCSATEVLEQTGAGIVVEQEDFETFGQQILALSRDPNRRAGMGRTARHVAEQRFSPEKARGAWLRFYEGLLDRPARREPLLAHSIQETS